MAIKCGGRPVFEVFTVPLPVDIKRDIFGALLFHHDHACQAFVLQKKSHPLGNIGVVTGTWGEDDGVVLNVVAGFGRDVDNF